MILSVGCRKTSSDSVKPGIKFEDIKLFLAHQFCTDQGGECRENVSDVNDLVRDNSGLDVTRPAHDVWHSKAALLRNRQASRRSVSRGDISSMLGV